MIPVVEDYATRRRPRKTPVFGSRAANNCGATAEHRCFARQNRGAQNSGGRGAGRAHSRAGGADRYETRGRIASARASTRDWASAEVAATVSM